MRYPLRESTMTTLLRGTSLRYCCY
jgi:hypothetical protein